MGKFFGNVAGNWKTTLAGVLSAASVIMLQVSYMFDGIDATNPDWNVALLALGTAVSLLFAKDGDKTSEDLKLYK